MVPGGNAPMMSAQKTSPLSLAFYTVPELAPPDVVVAAAAGRYAYMGLRLFNGQPADGGSALMTDPQIRRETMARMRDLGVSALDANTVRLVPQSNVREFEPFMAVAAEMGARHVLTTGNDPEMQRLTDNVAALAALAGSYGLTVEIEFVPWMPVANVSDAVAIVAKTGSDNIGVALDALHFQRSSSSLADIAAAPAGVFRYMHLCNAPGQWESDTASLLHAAVHERLPPDQGDIDLVSLLRAMPPDIPMALEVPMTTLARTVGPFERAKMVADAARRVLAAAHSL